MLGRKGREAACPGIFSGEREGRVGEKKPLKQVS
jgi:hypothetical protein